jgi:DNA-damage-inducible protein D
MSEDNKLVIFDKIRQSDGWVEFWSARDLQKALDYGTWERFETVIKRAKKSFTTSGLNISININDHFRQVVKMVELGSGAMREVEDYQLSRYACYLIAQNADPSKIPVAIAQAYFNIQTFRQEQIDKMSKEQRRLYIRRQVTDEDKKLFDVAKSSGVERYGTFYDAGYLGLYGMRAKEIAEKKRLGKDKILDRADATELAANLFRITQTQDKLQNELNRGAKVGDRSAANTHFMVGGKVRQTIKDIGGTMPEELPPAKENIKKLEKRFRREGIDSKAKKIRG